MNIAIVNDLPLAIESLKRVVALDPSHRVVWVAKSGAEALKQCAICRPDLILMDVIMPEMDGVEATRRIMRDYPCAILVVTVSIGANAGRVYQAMGNGALDAVDTPALGTGNLKETAAPLLTKLQTIAKLVQDKPGGSSRLSAVNGHINNRGVPLVGIGASAGGPAALATLLGALPPSLGAAVVLIQHVDAQFAHGMADWLAEQSAIPVRVAMEDEAPAPGVALLAATGNHLALQPGNRLSYTAGPADYIYRPSVDVFFQSVSHYWTGPAVGVLLTGMGRDGALGLKAMRNKGYYTIAQDAATSAVYGMPKAAAALDAAVDILPLNRIAPRLVDVLKLTT